jgi:hypothetical protein
MHNMPNADPNGGDDVGHDANNNGQLAPNDEENDGQGNGGQYTVNDALANVFNIMVHKRKRHAKFNSTCT